jgi:peptidoglycan/LPS O-acetylase OafA/YrhL
VAIAALALAGAALAASLRGEGWRFANAVTAVAAVGFGIAGLIFPADPGAPDEAWSWLAIAAGIGLWILTRIEAGREAPST